MAELQAQIQALLTQLQTLQTQLATAEETTVAEENYTRDLTIGSKGDDVKKLQEFLAQDKEIYPEGLITGYFGVLTQAAVKKWQAKNGIESVGIVGPKTRAKLNELGRIAETAPAPIITQPSPPAEQPTPVPSPSPLLESIKPAPMIKTGIGLIADNKNFKVGPVDFLYVGHYPTEKRGYLYPGDTSNEIANKTTAEYSSCEEISIRGYQGISDICQFTDPTKYTFSEHKEAIRLYDKNAVKSTGYQLLSCYQGILLFKEGNIYGAIDPEKIDFEGLHYRYWYDESGGSNFSSLCQQNNAATVNKMASALESLRSILENLKQSLE